MVKFHTGCGLVQCFKCCGYGHIAKNCWLSASCGHCAQTHETRECQQKDKSQCTNCTRGGRSDRGHKAWSESCYYRRRTQGELEHKLYSSPLTYATAAPEDRREVAQLVEPKRTRGQPAGSTSKTILPTRQPQLVPPPLAASQPLAGDEAAPAAKRARQTTLPFLVGEDVMNVARD